MAVFRWLGSFNVVLVLACSPAFAGDQIVFQDSFNYRGRPASDKWIGESHDQGRGRFNMSDPAYIDGSRAHIGVSPWNPSAVGRFEQRLIKSRQTFRPRFDSSRNAEVKIVMEARIRIDHNAPGVVHGFFTYTQYRRDGALRSDELDFEWLTAQTAGNRDPLYFSTWRNWNRDNPRYGISMDPFHGTHQTIRRDVGIQTNFQWHVYKIEWSRSRLDFFIDDRHVFEFTNPGEIPQRAMPVFLNSWVPDADWADAYSGAIQPAFNGNQRQWFNMLVDWVRVTEVW